jgi:hypothetical protein
VTSVDPPIPTARAASPSADSVASEISCLSKENSCLQASLTEKTEELRSMQQHFPQQMTELKESRQHEIKAAVDEAIREDSGDQIYERGL